MMMNQSREVSLFELIGSDSKGLGDIKINDIVLDSRQVNPGAAFFALKGSKDHGLDFKDEALSRGAVVIIYEQDSNYKDIIGPAVGIQDLRSKLGSYANIFFSKNKNLNLVGVTGTNGKSTVAYISALARVYGGNSSAYIGTIGKGVPPEIYQESSLTTPDCFTLHKQIRDLDAEDVIMEVSSHSLAQNRIDGLDFNIAAFTNLSHDHIDYHKTLEEYKEVKSDFFKTPTLQKAIIFVDDKFSKKIINKISKNVEIITTSLKKDADITGKILRCDLDGIVLEVKDSKIGSKIFSPLLGDFNAENLIVSLGILKALGINLDEASSLLSQCSNITGRMHTFGGEEGKPFVVVDYAHTPAALERVLKFLSNIKKSKLWCIFGCGGSRDSSKRSIMGNIAAKLSDYIILTDDNPRNEDPEKIISDICLGIKDYPNLLIERDRANAISGAIKIANHEDIILVAGKGHENQQFFDKEIINSSDLSIVKNALGDLL